MINTIVHDTPASFLGQSSKFQPKSRNRAEVFAQGGFGSTASADAVEPAVTTSSATDTVSPVE